MTEFRKLVLDGDVFEEAKTIYCPACGVRGQVFVADGAGDYYDGPRHVCCACGADGYKWESYPDDSQRGRLQAALMTAEPDLVRVKAEFDAAVADFERRKAAGQLTTIEQWEQHIMNDLMRSSLAHLMSYDTRPVAEIRGAEKLKP